MAELFDDDFFNKAGKSLKKKQGMPGWTVFLLVLLIAAVLAGAWWWRKTHDPATMIIDINRAGVEELQYLPDVGPVTAAAIVQGRPYASIDELKNVKGIGDKTFAKIRARIKLE